MYIISGCLCGVDCKYNGGNNLNDKCLDLFKSGKAILVCPEQLGGLETPRKPAELQGASHNVLSGVSKVLDVEGKNVTSEFLEGAKKVLEVAIKANITVAILKEGSPSCGVNFIYDGSFSGRKISGEGITATLLKKNGIKVISDTELGGEKSGILEFI